MTALSKSPLAAYHTKSRRLAGWDVQGISQEGINDEPLPKTGFLSGIVKSGLSPSLRIVDSFRRHCLPPTQFWTPPGQSPY